MDRDGIERARGGDAEAVGALLRWAAPLARRMASRMGVSASELDDVVQDALLGLLGSLAGFRGDASLSTWLWRVVRTAVSRRTRRRSEVVLDDDDAAARSPSDPDADVAAIAEARDTARVVWTALAELPEDYRDAILLRDVEELPVEAAAARSGLAVPAYKSRLHRARGALREAVHRAMSGESNAPAPRTGCPEVVSLWSRALEGDIDPPTCAALEHHMATCPTCDAVCAELRGILRACAAGDEQVDGAAVAAAVARAREAWAAG